MAKVTKTTIDVNDAVWKVVQLKAKREDISVSKALECIIERFIKEHGKEEGYSLRS